MCVQKRNHDVYGRNMDLVKQDFHTTVVKNLVTVFVARVLLFREEKYTRMSLRGKPHSLTILRQSYIYSSDSVYDRLILLVKESPNKE